MTDWSRCLTKVSMGTVSRSSLTLPLTKCSLCLSPGVARCSVCLAWYCSLACQGLHWPQHRRECVPPPSLLLPDGSPFQEEEGQLELTGMKDVLEKQDDEMGEKEVVEEKSAENPREALGNKQSPSNKEQESTTLELKVKGDTVESSTVSSSTNVDSPKSLRPPKISDSDENTQLKTNTTSPLKPSPTSPQEKAKPNLSTAQSKEVQPNHTAVPLKSESVSSNMVPFTAASSTPIHEAQASHSPPKKTKPAASTSKSKTTTTKPTAASNQSNKTTSTSKPEKIQPPHSSPPPSTTTPSPIIETKKIPAPQKTLPNPAPNTPQPTPDSTFYPPAVRSTELPPTIITPGLTLPICCPVLNIDSPFKFGVRLAEGEAKVEQLVADMTRKEPPAKGGWKVGRNQTLAVCYEEVWFRGVAVKKMGDQFSVYLLDYGTMVTASSSKLRPLPASYLTSGPANIQVCLAGVGPVDGGNQWPSDVCDVFQELINSDLEYRLGVEVIGQVEGGRWAVRLRGLSDQQDLGDMLVEAGVAVRREDLLETVRSVSVPHNTELKCQLLDDGQSVKQSRNEEKVQVKEVVRQPITEEKAKVKVDDRMKPPTALVKADDTVKQPTGEGKDLVKVGDGVKQSSVQDKKVDDSSKLKPAVTQPSIPAVKSVEAAESMSKIARGSFSEAIEATICFLESPDKFYVCASASTEQFMAILTSTQSPSPGQVTPSLGSCCLAQDEGCWYRAEVVGTKGQQGVASLFLLDYGKTMEQSVVDLRPLDQFREVPGLVVQVGLTGIKAKNGGWTEEEIEGARILLDVGGETVFKIESRGLDQEGIHRVTIMDCEGSDLTSLMVEAGIGQQVLDTSPVSLTYYQLSPGLQSLVLMQAESPALLHLSSLEAVTTFHQDSQMVIDEAAAQAKSLTCPPGEGERVLACEEDAWYRATVTAVLENQTVELFLVDMGCSTTLSLSQLREAPHQLFSQLPMLAIPATLVGWEGEDEKKAAAEWGDKLGQMVEQFAELEVEVVGTASNGRKTVKIPAWDGKLIKEENKKSKAAQLRMKLKVKNK